MKIILLWYLVSAPSNNVLTWSPPMATEVECVRVKKVLNPHYLRCIQIQEAVK